MNRRALVVTTAIGALGLFAAGTALYHFAKPVPNTGAAPAAVSSEAALIRPYSPVIGPMTAPVTIVEFFDPACETCRAFYPIVKQIIALFPQKVRLVLRYAAFHGPSPEAVQLLEAARLQGKFEPVLERLLQTQSRWAPHGGTAESVWSMLEGIDLDIPKAMQDARRPDIIGILNQDSADVKAFGIKATPTFLVNGKPLQQFGPQQLYDLVRREVEAL